MPLKNKVIIGLGACLSVSLLSACTSKDIYENVAKNQKARCEREFEGQAREDCMRGYQMSFEEYEEERKKVIEDQ